MDFYRHVAELPDEASPVEMATHFHDEGSAAGIDPRADFSVRDYLQDSPDVAAAGVNPLAHWVRNGQAEGRPLHLSRWRRTDAGRVALSWLHEALPAFDADHYRGQAPELRALSDRALAAHYLVAGWRDGHDPSPDFSTRAHLEAHPGLADLGFCPLLHHLVAGREGPEAADAAAERDAGFTLEQFRMVEAEFDARFYRAVNRDLQGDDAALLRHFMTVGWREGRDPRQDFSVKFYLDHHADVRQWDGNPFVHYLEHGRGEGRRANEHDPARLSLARDEPMLPPILAALLPEPARGAQAPRPPARVDPRALDLHWIVPDFSRGSGGHMTIFRTIRHLERLGHRCKIWIDVPIWHEDGEAAWQDIVRDFQCVRAEVALASEGLLQTRGDALIATGWTTAYLARAAQGFAERFYFVQDHEPEFYPSGTESLLARRSYGFDLACICAGTWLEGLMRDRYGRWARHFPLAFDPEVYRIEDPAAHAARHGRGDAEGPFRIAIYARSRTERRCVPLALMALQILGRERQDFEVHLFGQDTLPFGAASFPAVNHGVLDAPELAALYNRCHLGISLSGTNHSLVPQEMMACGLPVLELDGENTRAIFPEGTVALAGPDPEDMARAIGRLIDDPGARAAQVRAALGWVSGLSWEGSARMVEAAIVERLSDRAALAAPAVAAPPDAALDVVIPTWNGRGEIERVIEALRGQRAAEAMRIHCIDSSSTDGTTEWLRAQPDLSVTVIEQKDFQHGRTRNEGAAQGRAPIVAFLTQDAVPVGRDWAGDVLAMFGHRPDAAGLFGRHLPHPDHPAHVRWEIERHFAGMLAHPLILSRWTDPEKWESGDVGWRQLLHYYSDNNSALRRAVWEDIPYPEIDYGEDQVWARDIIEAGYSKLYAPTACVYHSHDYGPDETCARARTESAFFFRHFGYRLGDGTAEEREARVRRAQEEAVRSGRSAGLGAEEIEAWKEAIAARHRGWHAGLAEALAA